MMTRDEVVALYRSLDAPPFEELHGPSKLSGDTKDAFHLEYADSDSFRRRGPGGALLHTMFDEVRKISDGLHLGVGRPHRGHSPPL